jgi:hypothetical protein
MVLIKPHKATHAVLETNEGKKATVEVTDLDTLAGVKGKLTWMRLGSKSREILKTETFDGKIEEIISDYRKKR